MMKRLSGILLAAMLVMVCVAGCGNSNNSSDSVTTNNTEDSSQASETTESPETTEASDSTEKDGELLSGKYYAVITVKKYGKIKVELDADVAPITVTNFVKLVNEGFYDGLTFHRIISGFMIQGGDPLGNGTGGSDETIKGEFSANGVENSISHVRGTISMARSSDYDSASSQFFIMHEDYTGLDGQYAAFGTVLDGMDVVDKICEETPVTDDNGTVESDNQPVIKSIKMVEDIEE
jgi:peptidyl-prolyl cis-trans isomerase B (cyclophilin B)